MQRFWMIALSAVLACGTQALAAEATPAAGTPVGKTVANFTLPDIHGKPCSLDDYKDKVVVLAFLGTECPLAKSYGPRLRDLATEFEAQGVVFLGVDANLQDSLTELAAYARVNDIKFPMLKDNNNELADKVGAVRTPEVFVLDRNRVIRYWGRIDDQYGLTTGSGYAKPKLTQRNLADAVTEVVAGKPVSHPYVKADGCHIGRVSKTNPHGEVTYTKHIARIMENRCVECHRKGEVAPFALTSYDEVIGWAETIREVVSEGRMPPWFADPKFGHFSNDARLSDAEKQQMTAWVENGCPKGEAKDMPVPRKFVDGWRIGEPDQVFFMRDEPYLVQAEGTVDYQFYTVDTGWTEDKWIQATEARPGNRAVVHHIIVFVQKGGGGDAFASSGVGGYAPGTEPNVCPPGTAMFVPKGSKLVFQLHYTPNGTEQGDRSMIGVKFADPKTVKQMVRGALVGDLAFKIPPNDGNYEVKAKHLFLKDTLVLNLTPHMHLRGKDFKYEAEYPDGTREVLLDVPHYDFNWQLRYTFDEPKLMPKGTRLHCTAHFDNSADNMANPDPNDTVTFGEQTWEEMMFGFYTSIDPKQDLLANPKLVEAAAKEGGGFAGEGSVTKANAAQLNDGSKKE